MDQEHEEIKKDIFDIYLQFRYLDMVMIHYPKSDFRENEDPENKEARKDIYLELEKLKG